jgi:hypothetical protein
MFYNGFYLDNHSSTSIYTAYRNRSGELQRGYYLGDTRTLTDAKRQIDKGLFDDDARRANS